MHLTDYFTDEHIIRQLCKQRIKQAGRLRGNQDVARFVGRSTANGGALLINSLLPPRRQWAAFRLRRRNRPADVNLASLVHAAMCLRESQKEQPWAIKLDTFIKQVRQRVLASEAFSFARPGVKFLLKDANKYRALCRFSLEDNLINCLVARYLRDFLDPAFDFASYAFRSQNAQGVMPTHHGAFETLFQLKYAAPRQDFYVAECDIQGFYDTVHHGIALGGLENLVEELNERSPGCVFHPRAREVFRAYLDCYNFPCNVIMDSQERFKREHPKAIVPWPEAELRKYYVDPQREPIGVPRVVRSPASSPILSWTIGRHLV